MKSVVENPPVRIGYRPLSPTRVAALTGNTFTELVRLKVFYFLLIFALLLIGSSIFMAQISFQQEFQVLKDVSLGAMSIFTSLLAIVATAQLIPRDIEDRTIYTILAKPIPRYEYLAGKLLGVLLLLLVSLIAMTAVFLVVLFVRQEILVHEMLRQTGSLRPAQVQEAIRALKASAFNANLLPGIVIIYLKAALLASLTLFISTFATSNLFTIFVMVFIYFIGHLQATARAYWLQGNAAGWITKGFLALVALVFPDLQLFNLVDDIVADGDLRKPLRADCGARLRLYLGLFLLCLGHVSRAGTLMRNALVALMVLAFGAIRVPIESALTAEHRSAYFHETQLELGLREQIGQLGFLAALSGFRSLVADVVFIQAHVAWEQAEWGRVLLLFREATTLQPRSILFWDMAAWHMAWNASVAAMNDQSQPNEALRLRARHQYIELGKDFLERGIRNNPDRPQLYESLARLYQDKLHDHAAAARLYAHAASLPGAPEYDERFAAYELSYAPGQERAAYDALLGLYRRGPHERLPTLLKRLKFLEKELDIPLDQRIPDAHK
ncbi:MAG: ABC transporter permease subunit [Chthoniobacterales bacterium]